MAATLALAMLLLATAPGAQAALGPEQLVTVPSSQTHAAVQTREGKSFRLRPRSARRWLDAGPPAA